MFINHQNERDASRKMEQLTLLVFWLPVTRGATELCFRYNPAVALVIIPKTNYNEMIGPAFPGSVPLVPLGVKPLWDLWQSSRP